MTNRLLAIIAILLICLSWNTHAFHVRFAQQQQRMKTPERLPSSATTSTHVWQQQPHPNKAGMTHLRMTPDNSDPESSSSSSSSKKILQTIDKAGLSLKPQAVQSNSKMALAEKRSTKLRYLVQTCALYALFILYRAYRGLFVILPAVFREVYRKMEGTVESPYDDDNYLDGTAVADDSDRNPQTGKVRWRSRMTVSVLAFVVTTSYVMGGAFRVATRFLTSLSTTRNVSESFAAAANQQEANEEKILKMTTKKGTINGDDDDDDDNNQKKGLSDLAP